ncbi:TonB-dependent receptor domain protein [Nitrosococcus oceani AFC27]|nr:TonB-dependent receptor domain protein [Nitrosococcus oceani AFC27]
MTAQLNKSIRGKIMLKRTPIFVLVATACAASPLLAQDEEVTLPELEVVGQPVERAGVEAENKPFATPDTADLLRRVPGANVNANGPIAGMVQYRGMFGPRMNVRINGTPIESGGPNWMDPPLSYAPRSLVESIEVTRGVGSVSTGSGIGGYVEAKTKSSHFTGSEQFEFHSDVDIAGHSVDGGYNLGGILSLSNDRHRLHFLGSRDDGGDTEFGDGTIKATEYERNTYGAGYGFKTGDHEFSADYQRLDTENSGTPSLPMDISFIRTNRAGGKYTGFWNDIQLETRFGYSDVDHQMNNFRLRQAANFCALPAPFCQGDDKRLVNAGSEDFNYGLKATFALWGGDLAIGADGHAAQHNATVLDPDFAPFFVTNFNNAQINKYGFFSEWTKEIYSNWELQLGARYDRVEMDADGVNAFPAQLADRGMGGMPAQMIQMLRNRFNGADRGQNNNNVDWVAELSYQMNSALRWTFGAARKMRSPTYIQRYLWIPLEVNAGLGDGNAYVGNVALDPETSHELGFGFDWQTQAAYFSPQAYYRRVDDYIQGTPAADPVVIAVSTNAAGDATPLQFSNVDAEIYGLDADFGYRFHPRWRLDGVASYVRGKRRDINDNLYRIAPPNLRLSLTHERIHWFTTVESVLVYRQENISDTNTLDPGNANNTNEATPGYVLVNLYGQYRLLNQGITFTAGINNLLDKTYTNHLTGFNRVLNSDVSQGRRLPGPGRNFYAALRYEF